MKFVTILMASIVAASATPTFAVIQAKSFSVRATNFGVDLGNELGALAFLNSPIFELDFNLTIDDDLAYTQSTSGLTVTNLQFVGPNTSPFNDLTVANPLQYNFFNSFGSDFLIVSSNLAGAGLTCFNRAANSVCIAIQNPFADPGAAPGSGPALFFVSFADRNGTPYIPARGNVGGAPSTSLAVTNFVVPPPPPPSTGVVPEPGTWAMLVLGFGIVGVSLRRRVRMETNLWGASLGADRA